MSTYEGTLLGRAVIHMHAHPRVTLHELAAVTGFSLTDVGKRPFARLVYLLRNERIFQTSSAGVESTFEYQPDRANTDETEFVAPDNMREIYDELLRST